MMHLRQIYTCFPEGKYKALTFSYDDARQEDLRLVELFNRHALKATFNVNSDIAEQNRLPLSTLAALYQGHEIACHTATHPTLARCPSEQNILQILHDKMNLEALCDYPVQGLAYPNGSYTPEICRLLPSLGIAYGRTAGSNHSFAIPTDFCEWTCTCHHNQNLLQHGEEFLALHKKQHLYLMSVWGHSYEFAEQNNWNLIESFCEQMAHQSDIWYATNIEVVSYLNASKNLIFTASGDAVKNPNFCSIWISVDGEIFEIPGGAFVKFTHTS